MKVPVSWLRDYVDIPWSVEELAERLTLCGLEVEAIERSGPDLAGVVAARIDDVQPHPNADRLRLCMVDDGSGERVQVVCGAPNARAGAIVPMARVGAVLPSGMKIAPARLRGAESCGMLCSGRELEIDDDASGLLILPDDTPVGRGANEIFGTDEAVLEIEVTPNRPDCLSIVGVAREVAVLTQGELRLPDAVLEEVDPPVADLTSVDLQDADLCPRYTARVIHGVRVGASPDWMRRRLEAAGLRSISNLVDVTNYVMLELGQPLHAFDQSLLHEGRIVVRRARAGERIEVIDGTVHELTPEMLVIADADRAVAVAGVMGGADSGISEGSGTVLLESAMFSPTSTRATSRALELSSDASYRFERGCDVEGAEYASRRAASLIRQLTGGRVARGVIDAYPRPYEPREVRCRATRARSLLGACPPADRVRAVFTGLGLEVASEDEDGWTVRVPGRRVDLEAEVDLVEEIARIEGIDAIPAAALHARLPSGPSSVWWEAERDLRDRCVAAGLQEVMNYSLIAPSQAEAWGCGDEARWARLINPISEEQEVLRPSLLSGLVQTVERNLYRGVRDLRLFESGRTFLRPAGGGEPVETRRLGIALTGRRHPGAWEEAARDAVLGLFDLKGIIEALLAAYRYERIEFRAADHPRMAAGHAFEVLVDGEPAGYGGALNEALQEELRSQVEVLVAELDIDAVLTRTAPPARYRALPRYPSVVLDVAFAVDTAVEHAQVEATIRGVPGNNLLESIELFDIFISDKIGRGRKSMAYSLTYRDPERSLTVEEANAAHEKVKETLRNKLHCDIRQ